MRLKRLPHLAALCAALTFPALPSRAAERAKQPDVQLVTLGTGGGPIVRKARAQQANLLIIDGHVYLIDCGEGCVRRLGEAGFQPDQVGAVFVTHLHIDHTADLGQLVAYNWQFAGRRTIPFHGPPGILETVRAMTGAFAIQEQLFDPTMPPHPTMLSLVGGRAIDIPASDRPALVFEDERVKVYAVRNSHYRTLRMVRPAYGEPISYSYRFETGGRSFVFTGDTGPSRAVVNLAKNADVLVSEVVDLPKIARLAKERYNASDEALKAMTAHMVEEHLEPRAVGALAAEAGVKMVVLSHLVPGLDDEAQPDSYAQGVRETFGGPVVIARDLDRF